MHVVCPHCQSPVEVADTNSSDVVLCSSCGSSFGIGQGGQSTIAAPQVAGRLGKFELLNGVGSGAFGTVYKARDRELDRTVAIKIPRPGSLSNQADQERFLREARSVAQLRHPSIVSVFEVGQSDGTPYLVSEFVEGMTLADYLTGAKPSARETASLVARVADALQYAHANGVVHRDVKPSNIMLAKDGAPHVMDFGLARRDAGEATMTTDGQVLGTPAYMSPEQAKGESHSVDGRADVYSLGVILYQMLTGELPFRGNARMLLHQVLHDEPRSLRKINDLVPRDLETVSLKAMAKEAARRYATAGELADDLRRFLNNEPVRARPAGSLERAWRWSRRKPLVAGLVSAVALLLVGSSVGGCWLALRERAAAENERQANRAAQAAQQLASDKANEARQRQSEAELARTEEEQAKKAALAAREEALSSANESRGRLVRLLTANGMRAAAESDMIGTLPWLAEALRLDQDDEARNEMHRLRLGAVLRQTPRLALQMQTFRNPVGELSPDGSRIAICTPGAQTVGVWDMQSGNLIAWPPQHNAGVNIARFSPNGRRIVTAGLDGKARLSDAATGKEVAPPLQHEDQILHVAFSPDGRLVATASLDRTARVWSVETGAPVTPPLAHPAGVVGVDFSPDSKRLVATVAVTSIRVWDAESGREIFTLPHSSRFRWPVEFSRDGCSLVTAGRNGAAQLWDAETGSPQATVIQSGGGLLAIKISPDGRHVAGFSENGVLQVWDGATGRDVGTPIVFRDAVVDFVFSPDSSRIATTCADSTARVWEVRTGRPASPALQQNFHAMRGAQFTPDGTCLLTITVDGLLRLWQLDASAELDPLADPGPGRQLLALGPEGMHAVIVIDNRSVRLWHLREGGFVSPPLVHEAAVLDAAFSPDGKLVATGSVDGTARVWEVPAGKAVTPPLELDGFVQRVAISQNGQFVTAVVRNRETGSGHARVWGARDGRSVTPLFDHDLSTDAIPLISPDGSVVVAFQPGGKFQILDAKTGRPVVDARQGAGPKFNPDGRRFCYLDTPSREYRLLETSGWTLVGSPLPSPYPGLLNEFSPKGNRLVTAGDVQNGLTTMRVWDALTGDRIAVIENREAFMIFKQAAFSPDGQRLVAAAEFATSFQVWDVASGAPQTSAIPLTGRFDRAHFSSDGRRIVTISGNIAAAPKIQEWDAISGEPATLPRAIPTDDATRLLSDLVWKPGAGYPKSRPETRPVDDLTRTTRLLSLRRVDETGGLAAVPASEADEIWRELAAKYPSVFSRSLERKLGR